jgi:hypothetical protein
VRLLFLPIALLIFTIRFPSRREVSIMERFYDEFSKSLAASVPRRESLRRMGAVLAGMVLSPLGLGTGGTDPTPDWDDPEWGELTCTSKLVGRRYACPTLRRLLYELLRDC